MFLSITAVSALPQAELLHSQIKVERLKSNPIITPETDASLGININGPSLIRVPKWVEHPLGKYYLYFAAHNGNSIRLAYTDDLLGKWKVYSPGTLLLRQSYFDDHIASPDVIVDGEHHQFRLYFHGLKKGERGQQTRVALSNDGIHFATIKEPLHLSSVYWRLFQYKGWWYALAMGGKLFRSHDGLTSFAESKQLLDDQPNMPVHNGCILQGDNLKICYTRMGDTPERIIFTTCQVS